VIEQVGSDLVIWASDFPHPDATFPTAVDEFLAGVAALDETSRAAVLWETPMRFYRLEERFTSIVRP
jgi:predicted TIM-barrel fold metal-dependent hydrolase